MRTTALLLHAAILVLAFSSTLAARPWTSTNGKVIEADYVSATEKTVTIRRSRDRRTFTLPLATLSQGDRDYVKKRLAASKATPRQNSSGSPLGAYKNKFKGIWQKGQHGDLLYQIYAPKRVSRNKPLPVVVYLHGSLECGSDNVKQIKTAGAKSFVKFFKKRPCILIVPQTPTNWMNQTGPAVISLLEDLLKEVAVADRNRVYLTGYSLGGYGTWHILGLKPDLFAAGIVAAGGGNPAVAQKLKNVDVRIYHGTHDQSVPVEQGRKLAAAGKAAGAPIYLTEMKSNDHRIPGKVFFKEATHEWLFKQKRD